MAALKSLSCLCSYFSVGKNVLAHFLCINIIIMIFKRGVITDEYKINTVYMCALNKYSYQLGCEMSAIDKLKNNVFYKSF